MTHRKAVITKARPAHWPTPEEVESVFWAVTPYGTWRLTKQGANLLSTIDTHQPWVQVASKRKYRG